jgi:RNA-directed DNA polymerase
LTTSGVTTRTRSRERAAPSSDQPLPSGAGSPPMAARASAAAGRDHLFLALACPWCRKESYPNVKFDFLGYGFRPRRAKNAQNGKLFCNFVTAVSASALKSIRATIRDLNLRQQTHVAMTDIARQINPLLRGWIEYYGRYSRAALGPILRYVNQTVIAWTARKFKRFIGRKARAGFALDRLARVRPDLFAHWKIGLIGSFA